MERKKPVAQLEEHAGRTGSELRFEPADCGRTEQPKRAILGAVDNCVAFPIGVGADKKEAKESAAERALRSLSEQENWRPAIENVAKNPAAPVCRESLNVSCLNDSNQKKVLLKSVESRPGPNNDPLLCSFVVGDKENPAVSGKTKREAKEAEAKPIYNKISGSKTTEVSCSAVCGDGAPAKPSTPQTKPESCDAKSKSVSTADNDSNHLEVQDVLTPEETHTGDGLGKKTSPLSEIPGKQFELEFDSIEPISRGAFGLVFKAKEKLLNKYHAIKIVHYKESEKDLQEVKALSDLHHRNIVRYYSCWIEDSGYQWDNAEDSCSTSQSSSNASAKYLYIQMELCDTKTLRVWIDEKNIRNLKKSQRDSKRRDESLSIIQQLVSGVEYIHSKMLIHRDLKPANIMFGRDGEVKIGDFGLVTAENDDDAENLIERTVYKGTPSYMAPEQRSETTYDRKVDIFALGLIYFELLWKIPTVHERAVVLGDAREQKLPDNFSHRFLAEYIIIKPTLRVKPEERPEASQLKKDLDRHVDTLKTQATGRISRTR